MSKPLVVYVSGAPGAGKTSLARIIAAELYLPYVSSDLIHGGVRLTNKQHDRKETLHQVFVPLLLQLAKTGVSVVVDHVLQKDKSKTDIIDKLTPHVILIYIHVQAKDPIARHYQRERERTDRGIAQTPEELKARRDYHAKNLAVTIEPLEIGMPTLVVNTDDGYVPAIDHILDFIETEYAKEREL